MNLQQAYEYMKANAKQIDRLSTQGDKLALAVTVAYRQFHAAWRAAGFNESKVDPAIVNNYTHIVGEYLTRDVTINEAEALANRYGHKVDEVDSGPRIIVPDTVGKA